MEHTPDNDRAPTERSSDQQEGKIDAEFEEELEQIGLAHGFEFAEVGAKLGGGEELQNGGHAALGAVEDTSEEGWLGGFVGGGRVWLWLTADGAGVLHLEDGVDAEVDEGLHLLLGVALVDAVEEELALGVLDLGLVPLLDAGLFDLEVDALDAARAARDFDAAQVGLEVAEEAAGL